MSCRITVFTKYAASSEAFIEKLRKVTGSAAQIKMVSIESVTIDKTKDGAIVNGESFLGRMCRWENEKFEGVSPLKSISFLKMVIDLTPLGQHVYTYFQYFQPK